MFEELDKLVKAVNIDAHKVVEKAKEQEQRAIIRQLLLQKYKAPFNSSSESMPYSIGYTAAVKDIADIIWEERYARDK